MPLISHHLGATHRASSWAAKCLLPLKKKKKKEPLCLWLNAQCDYPTERCFIVAVFFFHLYFKGLPSSSEARWIKYVDIQVLTSARERQTLGIRWEEFAFFTRWGIVEKMASLDRWHLILQVPSRPPPERPAEPSLPDCITQTWWFNVLMSVCVSPIKAASHFAMWGEKTANGTSGRRWEPWVCDSKGSNATSPIVNAGLLATVALWLCPPVLQAVTAAAWVHYLS